MKFVIHTNNAVNNGEIHEAAKTHVGADEKQNITKINSGLMQIK